MAKRTIFMCDFCGEETPYEDLTEVCLTGKLPENPNTVYHYYGPRYKTEVSCPKCLRAFTNLAKTIREASKK